MHTLNVLLLAAAAACAVPRPLVHVLAYIPANSCTKSLQQRFLGPSAAPALSQLPHRMGRPQRAFLRDYMIPRMLMPNTMVGFEENSRAIVPAENSEQDWVNKEIDRIAQMEDDELLTPFEEEFSRWIARDPYIESPYQPVAPPESAYIPETNSLPPEENRPLPPPREIIAREPIREKEGPIRYHITTTTTVKPSILVNQEEKKKSFALTPLDKEFFETEDNNEEQNYVNLPEGDWSKPNDGVDLVAFQPARQTRQNPNLGRTKNLVAENLDRLRTGLTQAVPEGTDKPRHIHVLETTPDPADSIYGIALIAAVGTALTMAVIGFAFGWYTLSKKAKAAADVDYPAYGVTGPTIDTSGDRKLAHSAHMYHYQHQKQQIIAMERNGMDQRNGSVSDPESEEENEEGDYTVYECPGFATTGEMEVKNPLFSEDPTPATPGKCELVKPQPKE